MRVGNNRFSNLMKKNKYGYVTYYRRVTVIALMPFRKLSIYNNDHFIYIIVIFIACRVIFIVIISNISLLKRFYF